MPSPDSIVIAGAGPVGCVLALILAREGLPVVLLEQAEDLPEDLRASTFHPPTLDLLEPLGLVPQLLTQGVTAPTYQYRDRQTGERAVFDLAVLANDTRHPYRLQCEQFKLTRLVCQELARLPAAQVRFSSRVESYEEVDGGLVATISTPAGRERLRAGFLIGCDGAHSAVRKFAGIAFDGITYPEKFLVLSTDAPLDELLPGLSTVNYVADSDEWCTILKTRDLWRVLFPAPADMPDAQLLSDEAGDARLQRLAPQDRPYRVFHRTLYRVHQRVAATFRLGRVLLAGDAAHVNNPLGGMGMNSGLHDAFALGQGLLAWSGGRASFDVLDRYASVRRRIASQFVNEAAARNKRVMEERDPAARRAHLDEMQAIAGNPVRARQYLLRTCMIDAQRVARDELARDQRTA